MNIPNRGCAQVTVWSTLKNPAVALEIHVADAQCKQRTNNARVCANSLPWLCIRASGLTVKAEGVNGRWKGDFRCAYTCAYPPGHLETPQMITRPSGNRSQKKNPTKRTSVHCCTINQAPMQHLNAGTAKLQVQLPSSEQAEP